MQSKPSVPTKISKPQLLRVLMVEDSESDELLIIHELKKGGYEPEYERVETAAEMKKALKEKQWDIILCDYKMPEFNAPSAIDLLKGSNIDIPLIIVSGAIGEETAVQCMRSGAHDYIMKANLSRLCPAITRELEEAEVRIQRNRAESQREAALEALRHSEERYRSILDNIQEGYFEVDLAGNFTFFNDSLCRILGYSEKELFGMNNRHYTDKETAKIVFQVFSKVYNTGEPAEGFDWPIIRKDGAKRYVEASVSLQKDSSDKLTGFRGIVRDVTERKKAEKELQESEERFRLLADNSTDVIWEMTLEGKFTYISPSITNLSGYTPQEAMEIPFHKYVVESYVEPVMAEIASQLISHHLSVYNLYRSNCNNTVKMER